MDKNQGTFVTDITNKDELNEIEKIKNLLNPNEKVLLVARQSRFLPGGSALTPNVVTATDRRIIIRDPYDLGFRSEIVDIPYDVKRSVHELHYSAVKVKNVSFVYKGENLLG